MVHADETGWRENGVNGYVWTFSTPTERYFLRRGRNKEVVGRGAGRGTSPGRWSATSTPPTITTTAPSSAAGPHLLREIHDLRTLYSRDKQLAQWADAVHRIYRQARAFSPPFGENNGAPPNWPWKNACWPSAVPAWTTRWRSRASCAGALTSTSRKLFVFVAQPEVPPDNNAAERSLRPLVISRKISGGTRSNQGTDAKMDPDLPLRHLAGPRA